MSCNLIQVNPTKYYWFHCWINVHISPCLTGVFLLTWVCSWEIVYFQRNGLYAFSDLMICKYIYENQVSPLNFWELFQIFLFSNKGKAFVKWKLSSYIYKKLLSFLKHFRSSSRTYAFCCNQAGMILPTCILLLY